MKILIPIDRSTIRKNPNAGRKEYVTKGLQTITKTIRYNKDGSGYEEKYQFLQDNWIMLSQFITSEFNKDELGEIISIVNDMQRYYSLTPEPEYLYKHEEGEIACEHCLKHCRNRELIGEANEDNEGNFWTIYRCPHCNELLDIEIEYEKFQLEMIN